MNPHKEFFVVYYCLALLSAIYVVVANGGGTVRRKIQFIVFAPVIVLVSPLLAFVLTPVGLHLYWCEWRARDGASPEVPPGPESPQNLETNSPQNKPD